MAKLIYTVDMLINKATENKKKLSEPQNRIVEKLICGYRLRVINQHQMNGGTIVWVNYHGAEEHAGHIYKALQHLLWKLNIEEHTGLFI